MADLEAYKSLAKFLNTDELASDDIMSLIQLDFPEDLKYEHDGKEYDLTRGWDSEVHRYDEDKPEYWFWQFDKTDEYAVYVEGYYDSWAGSTLTDHEYKVGKVTPHVVSYTGFKEIK